MSVKIKVPIGTLCFPFLWMKKEPPTKRDKLREGQNERALQIQRLKSNHIGQSEHKNP